jgi:hypothetical protein
MSTHRVAVVIVNETAGSTSAQLVESRERADRFVTQMTAIFGNSDDRRISLIEIPDTMSDRDALTWAIEQARREKKNDGVDD